MARYKEQRLLTLSAANQLRQLSNIRREFVAPSTSSRNGSCKLSAKLFHELVGRSHIGKASAVKDISGKRYGVA